MTDLKNTNYSKSDIVKLINDLRTNPNGNLTPNQFSQALSHSIITNHKENLWQDFLEFLHDYESNPLTTQELINNKNSIFEYINNNADLDSVAFDDIFNYIYNIPSYNSFGARFWNESVNTLISTFIDTYDVKQQDNIYIYNANENYSFKNDSSSNAYIWYIENIKDSDAGNTFTFDTQDWVKPWINIDEDSFYTIEGINAISSIVNKERKIQFTRSQYYTDNSNIKNEWLRLLMPKNNRRVEVLDLNRNFWVIGQVLSAICAYLFKDNNSFALVTKKILNEQVQLWENLSYLWLMLAIYYNTASPLIHTQVLPVPPTKYQTERKHDVYNTTTDLNIIAERFNYLIDKYYNSNLVVIPEVYRDSWGENNFRTICYPGMLIHRANTDSFIKVKFQYEDKTPGFSFKIDKEGIIDLQDYVYGYHTYEDSNKLRYYTHFNQIDKMEDKKSTKYLCGVRTQIIFNKSNPYIESNMTKDNITTPVIIIPKLTINTYDIGRIFATGHGNTSDLGIFFETTEPIKITDSNIIVTLKYQNRIIQANPSWPSMKGEFYDKNSVKGAAYLPECISYHVKSLNPAPKENPAFLSDLNSKEVPLVPIFGIKDKNNYNGSAEDTDKQEYVEQFIANYQNGTNNVINNTNDPLNDTALNYHPIANKEINVLKAYSLSQDASNSTSKHLILYYGSHIFGLWKADSASSGSFGSVLPRRIRQYYTYDSIKKKTVLADDLDTLVWNKEETGLGYDLKQHNYDHNSLHLYSGAVLYIPPFEGETETTYYNYSKYWFYTTRGAGCTAVEKDGLFHFWNRSDTFTYYPDGGPKTESGEEKWAIRLVQVAGATNFIEAPNSLDTGFGKPYNALSLRVKVHLFFPGNEQYASRQWDRKVIKKSGEDYNVPTYMWQITQTVGNYDELRNKLGTGDYKTRKKGQYDFERYKDLGYKDADIEWNILDE